MTDLTESSVWETGIYQLELADYVVGGAGGQANQQAQELVNRTAKLRDELESNGIFIDGTHTFMGQNLILDVTFEGTVSDGDLVYYNTTSSEYEKAIANGTSAQRFIGIADVTKSTVFCSGLVTKAVATAVIGDTLYLDASTAGATTLTRTNTKIGIYLYDDIIFLDINDDNNFSDSDNVIIGLNSGLSNTNVGHTFVGNNAGLLQGSGEYNTNIGNSAGRSNVSGSYNTYIGEWAGYGCTGGQNTIVGGETFNTTTGGGYNCVLGYSAGYNANCGTSILIGFQAGYNNIANGSVFIGYTSGKANTSGTKNTFLGYETGLVNVDGASNTFIGYNTGKANISSDGNTFMGSLAGLISTGEYNTFIGDSAGASNVGAGYNTYVGEWCGNQATGSSNALYGSEIFSGISNSGTQNSIFGPFAAVNASCSSSTIMGFNAGYSTSATITAIGTNAGKANTIGTNNTFMGINAALLNTSGVNNTFMGSNTGAANISADNCTLVGYRAGAVGVTTVSQDEVTYIGSGAGENTIGDFNVYVGYNAGQNSGSDFESTIIGHRAGENSSSSGENVIIGRGAGLNNTGGQQVCIGNSAGAVSTISTGLVAVGHQSGLLHTSGQCCTYLGWQAGKTNSTGHENTFIGYKAGTLATGLGNTFLGYSTGSSVAAGIKNVMIGSECGVNITSGTSNVLIGQYVAADSTATGLSHCCIIGREAYGEGTGNYSVMMGAEAGNYCESDGAVGIGHQSAGSSQSEGMTGEGITCVGYKAGAAYTLADFCTAIGYESQGESSADIEGDGNTSVGYQTLYTNKTGEYNSVIGKGSGYLLTGSRNSALGYNAAYRVTGDSNTLLGDNSGSSDGGIALSGSRNVGVGALSLYYTTTGSDNIAIGYEANGLGILTGGFNISMGYRAGYDMTGGDHNISIGYLSGSNINTGDRNILIGASTGLELTDQIGNVMIGGVSGWKCTGAGNTFLGDYSGAYATSAEFNVVIGYKADLDTVTDDHKFILESDVAGSGGRLIEGDFSSGEINFNPAVSGNIISDGKIMSISSAGAIGTIDGNLSFGSLLHIQHQQNSGVNGGAYTADTWNTATLNTEITNEITDASLSSNQMILPAGEYHIDSTNVVNESGSSQSRIQPLFDLIDSYNTSGGVVRVWGDGTRLFVADGSTGILAFNPLALNTGDGLFYVPSISINQSTGADENTPIPLSGRFTLTAPATIELQTNVAVDSVGTERGKAASRGIKEIYIDLKIWKVN